MSLRFFTSESVTSGHPDKLCDQLSDAILDAILEQDSHAKVAVECLASGGLIHVAGEVRTEGYVDIDRIVRNTIVGIGYDSADVDFDGKTCGIMMSIAEQSTEINQAVDKDDVDSQGAGDQGIMFGYASNETPVLMPAAIWLAHQLSAKLAEVRKEGVFEYLRPDGKTQVTMGFEGSVPKTIETVVLSTQHHPSVSTEQLRTDMQNFVIEPILSASGFDFENYSALINPTGRFEIGGPMGDAGLTGRKIIVDTYGGAARHGGGAFSGKDPSKVDRSAAYAMRWVAKNIVAAGFADRAEVQVAYAIGKANPVGIYVETFGTEKYSLSSITNAVLSVFDLRPKAIINDLDLLRPIYTQTAAYGHFGRELPDFSWEKTDRVSELQKALRS